MTVVSLSNSGTTGSNPWPYWVNSTTSTITTASTINYSTQMVWTIWSGTTLGTASTNITNTITDVTWPGWIQQSTRRREISRADLAAAEASARDWERRHAAERKLRTEANDRAERILRESLTPKQSEDLAARGYFDLETIRPTGERKLYRIRRGRSRNIEEIDPASQRRIKTLCAHPVALVPDADTMLVQKLMLESSEDDFLRIANVS